MRRRRRRRSRIFRTGLLSGGEVGEGGVRDLVWVGGLLS